MQASHAAVWAAMLLLGLGAAGGFVPITPAVLKAAQIKVLALDCILKLCMCSACAPADSQACLLCKRCVCCLLWHDATEF